MTDYTDLIADLEKQCRSESISLSAIDVCDGAAEAIKALVAERDELLAATHETLSPQDVALAQAISKTIVIPNTIDRS